jgi:lipid A 3-O-deacylase
VQQDQWAGNGVGVKFLRAVLLLTGLFVVAAEQARSADLPARSGDRLDGEPSLFDGQLLYDSRRVEIRGGYTATVAGPERGASAISAELIAPKISIPWLPDIFTPRLHAGVTDSLSGKTSYGYVGALWRLNYTERLFGELTFGGAIHNGFLTSTQGEVDRVALGCRELYHMGVNFGYRIDPNWNAVLTFEHMSNGTHLFSNCPRNEGLNLLGLRVGRSF